MNGFCLPALGGASAMASMEGVRVAVNRHVCRSLGSTSNKRDNSGAKVGVNNLSASSNTYYSRLADDQSTNGPYYQKLDSREIPLAAAAIQVIDHTARSSYNYMRSVVEF